MKRFTLVTALLTGLLAGGTGIAAADELESNQRIRAGWDYDERWDRRDRHYRRDDGRRWDSRPFWHERRWDRSRDLRRSWGTIYWKPSTRHFWPTQRWPQGRCYRVERLRGGRVIHVPLPGYACF
ncbi:MAG: hypothetical protein V2I82_00080 [Halieaceae bacterium]|jgi:hypothetical protein|nr:hypothetical protein [Halieaceae bacterium]